MPHLSQPKLISNSTRSGIKYAKHARYVKAQGTEPPVGINLHEHVTLTSQINEHIAVSANKPFINDLPDPTIIFI